MTKTELILVLDRGKREVKFRNFYKKEMVVLRQPQSSLLTLNLIPEIARQKPYYAVFRDSSFASDSAMVNFPPGTPSPRSRWSRSPALFLSIASPDPLDFLESAFGFRIVRVQIPVDASPYLRAVTRGAEKADPAEIASNPRSASVRLRAVTRT